MSDGLRLTLQQVRPDGLRLTFGIEVVTRIALCQTGTVRKGFSRSDGLRLTFEIEAVTKISLVRPGRSDKVSQGLTVSV
jgi:hypothetical protein